eukprot:Nitzschia sp. Nitz4//scaffold83_size84149//69655//71286//NITZ4_005186-RA/size84149-processed-gene-0.79-mRNA-1//1//CDS//3329558983//5055//frame0
MVDRRQGEWSAPHFIPFSTDDLDSDLKASYVSRSNSPLEPINLALESPEIPPSSRKQGGCVPLHSNKEPTLARELSGGSIQPSMKQQHNSKEDDFSGTPSPVPPSFPLVTSEYVDSLVAQELSSLSTQDREQVYFDVHGVSTMADETPEFVQEKLALMDKALDSLDAQGEAYRKALALDAAYVRDQAFRLKFLRADRFDPQAGAARVARHFALKLELFGEEMLGKDITQENIDVNALNKGYFQTLTERDRSGRVVFFNAGHPPGVSILTRIQVTVYNVLVAANDVETQRRGCVIISFLMGKGEIKDIQQIHQFNMAAARVVNSLPMRMEALHLCTDDINWKKSISMFKLSGPTEHRLRIREHVGTREECLFQLQTFGIPVSNFPVNPKGELDSTAHVSLMKKFRFLEILKQETPPEEQSSCQRVVIPGRHDVLFGRGTAFYRYIGNLRLRHKVSERAKEYDESNKKGKTKINDEVVHWIKETGQFLEDTKMGWAVVSDMDARKKVAHMFRDDRFQRVSSNAKNNDAKGKKSQETKTKRGRETP